MKQLIGIAGGVSYLEGMNRDTIKEDMLKFVENQFEKIEADPEHPFWKSRAKTQDRFVFLEE